MDFTLRQISEWTREDSKVQIPSLQRGLVWKPAQVEMLWDSILRGFPIGSFMLSEVDDNQFFLLDGQQRFNAISLGYGATPDAKAIVWIDCAPERKKDSTRKFWIKSTTEPHPWGFANNDQCSPLSTSERRDAVGAFGFGNYNIYNDEFSLIETWPIKARFPIPLHIILKSDCSDKETFLADIKSNYLASNYSARKRYSFTPDVEDYIQKDLYPYIKSVADYRVTCNVLSRDVLEAEDVSSSIDIKSLTALELLFNRLNTGGTPISREDLTYSSIKAYWPDIYKENDRLAKLYMPPSKLILLAFRLALSQEVGELKGTLSPQQVRSIARKDDQRKLIDDLYDTSHGDSLLERILRRIDNWLGVSDSETTHTPAFIRTSIVRNDTELYLLLMLFARISETEPERFHLKPQEIKALALGIHWFGNDHGKCVQEILNRSKDFITLDSIRQGIARAQHDCFLLHTYPPEEVKAFFEVKQSPNWYWHKEGTHWTDFYWRIYSYDSAYEMLLYAEREYINTHFSKYDPARKDMWDTYNRPWDMDHIIPQDWFSYKQGPHREYGKRWLWSIGNFAAISYEINRGKGNRVSYDDYRNYKKELLFDERFEEVAVAGANITNDAPRSFLFAQVASYRVASIYERTYEALRPVFGATVLSKTLSVRKTLFSEIKNRIPTATINFAAGNDMDYPVLRENDWTREWLNIGVARNNFYACFEWAGNVNSDGRPTHLGIGIRRAPGTSYNRDDLSKFIESDFQPYEIQNNNTWWYVYRSLIEMNIDDIVCAIEDLVKRIEAIL